MSTNFSIDALLNNNHQENKTQQTFYINPLFQTFLNQLQTNKSGKQKRNLLLFSLILYSFS
jgi:hypothetical protein